MEYNPTIGLEIHAQLKTKAKMFCSCSNEPDSREVNNNVCPVCLGHPGALPVINKEAVLAVLKTGRAVNCQLSEISRFDRKNYFYPDLPKGYQISQDKQPLCRNGHIVINGKKIRINRIHLEEDTGRLMHDADKKHSLVDFNRSGIPLMELVTEADIRTAEEAKNFGEELRLIFRYIGVSDANMDQGQMRVEVNISLSNKEDELGTKVEIKNLNSFRVVHDAVLYEVKRQTEVLEKGEKIVQETRGWSDEKQATFSQREKESAHDYRYFPEPDLPPLDLNEKPFSKNTLRIEVELPQEKRERLRQEYFFDNNKEIELLITNTDLADYFEDVIASIKTKVNDDKWSNENERRELVRVSKSYMLSDLIGALEGKNIKENIITADHFADFVILIYGKEIGSKIAKMTLVEMTKSGKSAKEVIKEKNLSQIDNQEDIEDFVRDVIKENEKAVKDYKQGKESAVKFLIGQVMAKSRGRANPTDVDRIIKESIK